MTDNDIEQLHPSLGKKNDGEPRVYVACLGCYNEGVLHGAWMDTDELESEWNFGDLREDGSYPMTRCKKLHHEEWAIHDKEYIPCGEHPDIDDLLVVMRAIEEHGDAFREWYEYNAGHYDDPVEMWEEQYQGEYDSEKDFAEEWASNCGYLDPITDGWGRTTSNPLLNYIDWDWYWRAELRHSFTYSNGHVWSDY